MQLMHHDSTLICAFHKHLFRKNATSTANGIKENFGLLAIKEFIMFIIQRLQHNLLSILVSIKFYWKYVTGFAKEVFHTHPILHT